MALASEIVSRGQTLDKQTVEPSGVWGTLGVPAGTCRQPGELSAGM
jgi:hypothetical protein